IGGEERLVVVQEVDPRRLKIADGMLEGIRLAVTREHEVQPHAIALIRPGAIPKTSSGKIQRGACRAMFLERRLDVVPEWMEKAPAKGAARVKSQVIQPPDAKEIEFWMVSQLAARLGIDTSAIDVNHSLLWYGLDSLAAVELMHGMECILGA